MIVVATSSVMMLAAIIIIVFVCRHRLRVHVGAGAVTAVDVSSSSGQQDDVQRLLPTDDLLHHPVGSVDDEDDDDELHRGRGTSSSSRLDFDVTRHSISSRRCLVETDEVDSERALFILHYCLILILLSSATLFQ